MSEYIRIIKRGMIDAGLENFKDLAKALGMKYDTLLVRLKDPGTFRAFEIINLAEVLNLTDAEIVTIVRS